jgi:hypothetical protein
MMPMKSQVAITVSGHVFAYPTVMSVSTSRPLPRQVAPTAAQDAPRLDAGADRHPLWPVEFAITA